MSAMKMSSSFLSSLNFSGIIMSTLILLLVFFFVMSVNSMKSFISLFVLTLTLGLCLFISMWKFWPISLFLVCVTTGMYVVFAYIVSCDSKKMLKEHSMLMMILSLLFSFSLCWELGVNFSEEMKKYNTHWESYYNMVLDLSSILGTLVMVIMLVVYIILFIRLLYSKGGGTRETS